jgi:hypothetical protein
VVLAVPVALDALLVAWLLLLDDEQPDTSKEARTRKKTAVAIMGLTLIRTSKKRMVLNFCDSQQLRL